MKVRESSSGGEAKTNTDLALNVPSSVFELTALTLYQTSSVPVIPKCSYSNIL
jgi:hypothetical protein